MAKKTQVESSVRALTEGVIKNEGYELVDVEYVMDRGKAILRMYVDTVPPGTKEHGITVDDCSRISHVLGDILDVEEDVVPGEYTLEVSSPGIFRPLTKTEHFDRVLGERVKLKTFEKLDGRKVFTGILLARQGDLLSIDVDGHTYQLNLEKVAKANLEPLL